MQCWEEWWEFGNISESLKELMFFDLIVTFLGIYQKDRIRLGENFLFIKMLVSMLFI